MSLYYVAAVSTVLSMLTASLGWMSDIKIHASVPFRSSTASHLSCPYQNLLFLCHRHCQSCHCQSPGRCTSPRSLRRCLLKGSPTQGLRYWCPLWCCSPSAFLQVLLVPSHNQMHLKSWNNYRKKTPLSVTRHKPISWMKALHMTHSTAAPCFVFQAVWQKGFSDRKPSKLTSHAHCYLRG